MLISKINRIKAEELLHKLALDEKIGMIHGAGLFRTEGVARLGIPPLYMSDGPMGVRMEFKNGAWEASGNTEDFVTYLPSNSAIASTWNRRLAFESGSVLGEEARGRGKDVILAPGINIKRSPLNGRNFEYMSEDPYLTAQQCVPLIQGIQQHDVAACVKHFAVNSQETNRLKVDVEIEERALREIYLPAFRAAIKEGGSLSIMGAYNLLRGSRCCENKYLMNQILRKEWGYDGVAITDWGAVADTVQAAQSSIDIEMNVTNDFDQYYFANPLKEAVVNGTVTGADIDQKVFRVLCMMLELHMLDDDRKSGCYNTFDHRQAVLEVGRESIILLKNEESRLPLKKEDCKKILVIGQNADKVHSCGGGSAEIKALYEISPLMGLKSQMGGNSCIDFVKGYYMPEAGVQDASWQEISLESRSSDDNRDFDKNPEIASLQEKLLNEAVAKASEYDQVIFVGGLDHIYDLEGQDRSDMRLPYGQDRVIEEVLKVNSNTIIVMVAGSPVEMKRWEKQAKAIIWCWYAGMEGGNALAEVLLGKINPSGKLPETFPYTHLDCSAHSVGDFGAPMLLNYREGIYVGYRHYDKQNISVQFPFGHGLSYTTFTYSNLLAEVTEDKDGLNVRVSCNIKNTGHKAGKEIVQLYTSAPDSSMDRPVKELKGYEKISLQPGETGRVNFRLKADAFSYYDETEQCFKTDQGIYKILVGASAADIRLRENLKIINNYRHE